MTYQLNNTSLLRPDACLAGSVPQPDMLFNKIQRHYLAVFTRSSRVVQIIYQRYIVIFLCAFLLVPSKIEAAIDDRPIENPHTNAQFVNVMQAMDESLLRNPRVASSRATLGISKALLAQATVYPNGGLEIDNGFHAENTFRFGAFVPLEPPWKMALRVLSAKKQITQADLMMQQQLWLLRGEVRRAYTEFVIAEESSQTLKEITELTRVLTKVVANRVDAGDVPKLDLYKAQLALSQAEVDSEAGDRRILLAREQLNVVMGRPLEAPTAAPPLGAFKLTVVKNDLLPDLSRPLAPLSDYVNMAVANRLEFKVIAQSIEVNKMELKLAYANIVPNSQMSLGRSIVTNGPGNPNTVGVYMTGQFPLPGMFNVNQGEIKRVSATIRQFRVELEAQKNTITGQVDMAYRRLVNARETMRNYQQRILPASENVAHLAQLSYKNGQSDITAALTAQQTNIQVRNQYLNAVMTYETAYTDLEQAVGKILQ
jgi:outer membrane protein, heavy metal efflux system